MIFKEFVISKQPLLVDENLHLTAAEMFRLHDEWERQEKIEFNGRDCVFHSYDMKGICIVCGFPSNLYFTQDNHLKTSG